MFGTQGVKRGVRTPIEESNEQFPPQKLLGMQTGRMVLIAYSDAAGKKHEVTVVQFGNKFFMPPNSEQWTYECKPLAEWLSKQLVEKLEDEKAPIKAPTDAVDPLG